MTVNKDILQHIHSMNYQADDSSDCSYLIIVCKIIMWVNYKVKAVVFRYQIMIFFGFRILNQLFKQIFNKIWSSKTHNVTH